MDNKGVKIIKAFDLGIEIEKHSEFEFKGKKIFVSGSDDPNYHTVHTFCEGDIDKCYNILNEFVSCLSWSSKQSVKDGGTMAFGNGMGGYVHPRVFPRIRGTSINKERVQTVLDNLDEDKQFLLSFYREAISSDSPFYSFLSLYKIIEHFYDNEKEIVRWINGSIEEINRSREYYEKILKNNPKINFGKQVCKIRDAIAHPIGTRKKIMFDNFDRSELVWYGSVLQELSEIIIDKEAFNH